VAITNSWNEFVPSHYHLRRLALAVKIGIWQAGGMPIEFDHIAPCKDSLSALRKTRLPRLQEQEVAKDIGDCKNL